MTQVSLTFGPEGIAFSNDGGQRLVCKYEDLVDISIGGGVTTEKGVPDDKCERWSLRRGGPTPIT